ncbi:2-hydroxyacid dehydrogenase [Mycolicibacterium madagascariense]|uniref:2-hydroxyacid dehydrogenase n=1 Tax=Mycolicibacterium madagascariense TaxID=212765 RepID=A0A7I7X9I9_9MYCO|nr:D-2-hydroxyacid dehydrogenase family protein [Mycolicibacterium madagascariense]MCV7012739.1 D-2-hydroxyacid dehydrogenase family protein [Mycolicibacterium madagascariense]BBZ26000.1 2-hydroxyacid dehydrogenase [Mycolicibacterium madagascariense]
MSTVTVLDDYQGVALSSTDWSAVQETHTVDVIGEHIADPAELVDRLRESEVVVAMRERTPFPASVLDALPALRLLVTTGMVNASIDVAAAARRGITVCGTGGSGNAMPELTMGMIIALTRNFAQEDAAVRRGGWQHTIGPGLSGSTLGIVGLGRLGIPVARLGQAFGMSVIAWSPHLTAERAAEHGVRAVTKAELFGQADVITVHVPLADGTRGMVGAADLTLMKPTAYLVNTSRGPIVDRDALISALREQRIAGAGLDVYDVEPLPLDDPLRSLPNTLLLPHIGYVTTDAYRVFYRDAVEDILAFDAGAPVRVITP